MTDEILQKLAAANSPEEVQACLDEKGYKLVSSGGGQAGEGPPASEPTDDPPSGDSASSGSPFGMDRLEGVAKKAMAGPSRKEKKAEAKASVKKAFGGGYGN